VFAARSAELRRFAAKNLQAVEKDRETISRFLNLPKWRCWFSAKAAP
jgi:hypothetical protein